MGFSWFKVGMLLSGDNVVFTAEKLLSLFFEGHQKLADWKTRDKMSVDINCVDHLQPQ
jgi:hypothetical protein